MITADEDKALIDLPTNQAPTAVKQCTYRYKGKSNNFQCTNNQWNNTGYCYKHCQMHPGLT